MGITNGGSGGNNNNSAMNLMGGMTFVAVSGMAGIGGGPGICS